ncbi:MAG: hypothetical protein LBT54_02685 [Bifidobacteriaceae bacterium]|jgi:hypothetical protein|nr:hypothetical protein [Bifidobacteriaceae bacterium]
MRSKTLLAWALAPTLAALCLAAPAAPAATASRSAAPRPAAILSCKVAQPKITGSVDQPWVTDRRSLKQGKRAKVSFKVVPKSCGGSITLKEGKKTLKKIKLKKGKGTYTLPKALTDKAGKHTLSWLYKSAKRKAITPPKKKVELWVTRAAVTVSPQLAVAYQSNYAAINVTVDYRGYMDKAVVRFGPQARPDAVNQDAAYRSTVGDTYHGLWKETHTEYLYSMKSRSIGAVGVWPMNVVLDTGSKLFPPGARASLRVEIRDNTIQVGSPQLPPGDYVISPRPKNDCLVNIDGPNRAVLGDQTSITAPTKFTVNADDETLKIIGCVGGPVKV